MNPLMTRLVTAAAAVLALAVVYFAQEHVKATSLGNAAQFKGTTMTTKCPKGQVRCQDGCKNLSNDTNNCGQCGTTCPTGRPCIQGRCQ